MSVTRRSFPTLVAAALPGCGIGLRKGWLGHTGTGVGFSAAAMYDPSTRATIAVSVNATPSGGRRHLDLAQEIFAALADVIATG